MVLDDFEEKPGLIKWEGSVSLSEKFSAHGKSCCKLDTTGGAPLRLETRELPEDWSAFEYLKFDIYNPSVRLYYGTIRIYDGSGTDEQAEFQGQSYNGEKLFLNTGWNHFESGTFFPPEVT